MLSYRHAFHAGNHADVLKHLILLQIAEYMGEKPAPFWIIDTHAGAGRYALENVAHLDELPATGFYLVVAPIKIENGSGGPARRRPIRSLVAETTHGESGPHAK